MKKKKILVTVSGGRSSAMMARYIQTAEKYRDFEKLYVFCNTGQERPETIEFLKDIVKHWEIPLNIIEGVYSMKNRIGVSSKLVDFDTMDMTGRVYSEMIAHVNKHKWVGVPNQAVPYCSEYLKKRPSHHFAKKIFGCIDYDIAIGYRFEDIPKRITFAELRENKRLHAPLLTEFGKPITKVDLTYFFLMEKFQLGIKSSLGNCELCWKKSDINLIEAINHGTRFIDWHINEEEVYKNNFFRGNRRILDIVAMAKAPQQSSIDFSYSGDGCICSF